MKEEVNNVAKMKACAPGLDAQINCLLPLVNIEDDHSSRQVGLSLNINETETTTITSLYIVNVVYR